MKALNFLVLVVAVALLFACGGDGSLDVRPAPTAAATPTETPIDSPQ